MTHLDPVEALAKQMHDDFATERGLKLWDEDDADAPQKDIYRVRAQKQLANVSDKAVDE